MKFLALLAAAIGAALVLLLPTGADGGDTVTIELPSANGLRSDSPVRMGGIEIGRVSTLELGKDDVPRAIVQLDAGTKLNADATAEIVTSNLLGSKFLQLTPGASDRDMPDDARIPASRVAVPTDLDQVLNTLTPDVRARAQILINETGTWLTGRGADFNRALRLLPQDLDIGTVLLDRVLDQNDTLRTLVARSSSLMTRLAPERRQLADLVGAAGRATQTTARRQTELRATLASAPGTLRALTMALGELDRTAQPLGLAARNLSATAPALKGTLDALPAFESNARPTLRTLREVAPQLTALGTRATPVLRRAVPSLSSLASTVGDARPVTRALDVSVDDVLGLVEGWARSIQTRDTVSHVFRGRASIGAESLRSLLSRIPSARSERRTPGAPAATRGNRRAPDKRRPPSNPNAPAAPAAPTAQPLIAQVLNGVNDTIGKTKGTLDELGTTLDGTPKALSDGLRGDGADALLDYLLRP